MEHLSARAETQRVGSDPAPASAHYFGPAHERFAMVSWPAGPVRAGAVICPPLGYEAVNAHTSLRSLAESLAGAGIVAARIDYAGTGNSLGGPGDPESVAAWKSTISQAAEELRRFGAGPIVLIGVRFGGTLAANVTVVPAPCALVLWDPVLSGRRYTRTLRLLASPTDVESPAESPGAPDIVAAGARFSSETLAAMATCKIEPASMHVPTLVIERTDDTGQGTTWSDAGQHAPVSVVRLDGTAELLETDAELAAVPHAILSQIVHWVTSQVADEPARTLEPPAFVGETRQPHAGGELCHRALRLGKSELFAIETTLVGNAAAAVSRDRAVVFLNNGVAANIGPGRAWVDWGTEHAAAGLTALRIDLAGLGETRPPNGQAQRPPYYPSTAIENVRDAVSYLRARGAKSITLTGLCSGAVIALRAAADGVPVEQVIAINPPLGSPVGYFRFEENRRNLSPIRALLGVPMMKSPLFPLFDRVPSWIWQLLAIAGLLRLPVDLPAHAMVRGVATTLVFGDTDWGLRALRRRSPRHLAALTAAGLDVAVVDDLEHSMFNPSGRDRVARIIASRLTAGAGTNPVTGASLTA